MYSLPQYCPTMVYLIIISISIISNLLLCYDSIQKKKKKTSGHISYDFLKISSGI